MSKHYRRLAGLTAALAFIVIVVGAWVRLSDAGLGCPDWPGCYGQLTVPETEADVAVANMDFPDRPVEAGKAWREMFHRYIASLLGLLITILAVWAVWRRQQFARPLSLPVGLLALVIFQGLLGMWTVTLLLQPLIVVGHLLGGMATLALLFCLTLVAPPAPSSPPRRDLRGLGITALIVVACQIALGGWTSGNYAALACPDFPLCQTQLWPDMDFNEGFASWRGIGIDYEGGVLDNTARVAIHMTHRLGAIVTTVLIVWFGLRMLGQGLPAHANAGVAMLVALLAQVSLGGSIVLLGLPLTLAAAHNGTAAVLLLTVIYANRLLRPANAIGVSVRP